MDSNLEAVVNQILKAVGRPVIGDLAAQRRLTFTEDDIVRPEDDFGRGRAGAAVA
jgi:hypothetical protein